MYAEPRDPPTWADEPAAVSGATGARSHGMKVLICYDGSADARAAIDRAGQLMPGAEATVLVIWETIIETLTRLGSVGMGFGMVGPYRDDGSDGALEKAALDTATDGAQRATSAGFVARPQIANRRDEIAIDILAVADEIDADLIVLGTRGRGGVKSLMLGSVSNAVLHHADRSVLVIPSPSLAEERHRWADRGKLTADVT
jgi:nucleotide-binding universal stress UspA family protein